MLTMVSKDSSEEIKFQRKVKGSARKDKLINDDIRRDLGISPTSEK